MRRRSLRQLPHRDFFHYGRDPPMIPKRVLEACIPITEGLIGRASVEVPHNEGRITCTDFLVRAVEFYRKHGVVIERVMTDNGPGYRSRLFKRTCRRLQIRHIYTNPYSPQTNGKAERFIRTLKKRRAYAAAIETLLGEPAPSSPSSMATITSDPILASAIDRRSPDSG